MFIQHTSSHEQGQIYIDAVNWALMLGVVLLVIGFGSSDALAAAYGVAVTGTMLITTLLASAVMLLLWKWPPLLAVPVLLAFLLVDGLFFVANLPKVLQGGAFPVLAGIVLFILMSTRTRGRQLLLEHLDEGAWPLPVFIMSIRAQPPHRAQGRAIFLSARTYGVPHALLINLLHNQVLHQTVVLLTVVAEDEPRVPQERRFEVEAYGEGFYRVQLHFGFMGSRTCRRRWVCVTWTGWISARSAAPTSSAARQ